nr:hypothetical protein [uncultured Sulfurimonas sp.]
MVKNNTPYKLAFTMIELIFAIVVIAISVVSLPMITQITMKTIDDNLVQEAIFASVAGLNEATSYRWDEHSMNDKLIDPINSRVINTGDCVVGIPNKRLGHINRQCLENLGTAPYVGGPPYSDSLDEAAHGAQSIYIVGATTSAEGYKKLYNSTLTVTPNVVFEDGAGNNPNMKEIILTVLDASDSSTVVQMKTYSANIGEITYERKFVP